MNRLSSISFTLTAFALAACNFEGAALLGNQPENKKTIVASYSVCTVKKLNKAYTFADPGCVAPNVEELLAGVDTSGSKVTFKFNAISGTTYPTISRIQFAKRAYMNNGYSETYKNGECKDVSAADSKTRNYECSFSETGNSYSSHFLHLLEVKNESCNGVQTLQAQYLTPECESENYSSTISNVYIGGRSISSVWAKN